MLNPNWIPDLHSSIKGNLQAKTTNKNQRTIFSCLHVKENHKNLKKTDKKERTEAQAGISPGLLFQVGCSVLVNTSVDTHTSYENMWLSARRSQDYIEASAFRQNLWRKYLRSLVIQKTHTELFRATIFVWSPARKKITFCKFSRMVTFSGISLEKHRCLPNVPIFGPGSCDSNVDVSSSIWDHCLWADNTVPL